MYQARTGFASNESLLAAGNLNHNTRLLSPQGKAGNTMSQTAPSPEPGKIGLERSQSSSFERDIAVLSTAYLLQDNPKLKEVISIIVAPSIKEGSEKIRPIVEKCARFSIQLAQFVEGDPIGSKGPLDQFRTLVQLLSSFDSSRADDTSVAAVETQIEESLTKLEASYLRLQNSGDLQPLPGFSGRLAAIPETDLTIVEVLKEANEAIDFVVPVLKPVFASVASLLHAAQQTRFDLHSMKRLATTAGTFALRVQDMCLALQGSAPPGLPTLINSFESRLNDVAKKCQVLSRKPLTSRLLPNSNDKNQLEALNDELDAAMQEFQDVNLVHLRDAPARVEAEVDPSTFDQLPEQPHATARLSDYMSGSRQQDVDEVLDWFDNLRASVFWIDGSPGQGKSTLMRHVAEQMRSVDRLAASIFLGGELSETVAPETVVKILSSELGKNHPHAIPKIVEAISQCDDLSLKDHIQTYILEPLRSLGYSRPLLIAIDALDEWKHHPIFLKELAHFASQCSLVKFIVTSRLSPKAALLDDFDCLPTKTHTLLPVPNIVVKEYLNQHLKDVEWPFNRLPSSKEVDQLAKQANGLLVWVSTVCSLLADKSSEATPHEVLRDILKVEHKVGESEQLAELYRSAITRLFPIPSAQESLRRYLGATIVLEEPLRFQEFAALISMQDDLVKEIQTFLSTLQTRSAEEANMIYPAAAIFHLSFIEYVRDSPFSASALESHSILGLACLHGLPTSLSVLSGQLPESGKPEYRSYAAKFWPLHVSKGTPRWEEEWARTLHSKILQETPIGTLQQWAQPFLLMVLPGWEASSMQFPTHDEKAVLLQALALTLSNGKMVRWQVCCLEIAVRLAAHNERLWQYLGECYDSLAKTTESRVYVDEAVKIHRHALQLLPLPHPHRSSFVTSLGNAVLTRFRQNGSDENLNEAILLYREALQLLPATHPDRSSVLNNLAVALGSRFKQKGTDDDLDESISLQRESVQLERTLHGSAGPMSLNNFGIALHSRFSRNDSDEDLEEAISLYRDAVGLASASDPDLSMFLNNFADGLLDRFKLRGSVDDLNDAICFHREALRIRSATRSDRCASLHNLASALLSRFRQRNSDDDLNDAISMYREAVQLWPITHPDRPISLSNLASALFTRFKHNGADEDLEESISLHREVLQFRPTPHPSRPESLHDLAEALLARSQDTGQKRCGDIDEAISLHREAVHCRPEPHPHCFSSLSDLAHAIWCRFELTKTEEDLDEVISIYRTALQLDERYYFPDRFNPLSNFATTLLSSFKLRGSKEHLDEAISLHRKAVRLCPESHPKRSMYLNNFAIGLMTRHRASENDADLEESIAVFREALQHPESDFTRLQSFLNLSNALAKRFDRDGTRKHLDEAVSVSRDCLGVFPPEHDYREICAEHLCDLLKLRVQIARSQDDLDEIKQLEAELESESDE